MVGIAAVNRRERQMALLAAEPLRHPRSGRSHDRRRDHIGRQHPGNLTYMPGIAAMQTFCAQLLPLETIEPLGPTVLHARPITA